MTNSTVPYSGFRGRRGPCLALILPMVLAALALRGAAVPWVRPDVSSTNAAPRWGLEHGLQWALHPSGFTSGDGGPRGLIRLGYPVLAGGGYDLINFIAVEPVVRGRRGFSELERSRWDGRNGKVFWTGPRPGTNAIAGAGAADPGGVRHRPGADDEELSVIVHVEPFDNGAHVRLVLTQRSGAPDELRLRAEAESDSAPIESCILTATMGNKARTRLLWLAGGTNVSSLRLFGDYAGDGFTAHRTFPLAALARDGRGDVIVPFTNDEADPAAATGISPFWAYRGVKVTQYWRREQPEAHPGLRAVVNARFCYWMSKNPLPGGLAFENVELVEPFSSQQEAVFGITRRSPRELLR
jgi:hypothetical protein